jgi:hypothetical protein
MPIDRKNIDEFLETLVRLEINSKLDLESNPSLRDVEKFRYGFETWVLPYRDSLHIAISNIVGVLKSDGKDVVLCEDDLPVLVEAIEKLF